MDRLTFDRFAAALFFIAVGCTACLMPAQNDTWWHLRAGQVIFETGTIPLRDSFSHTVNGAYWPDHEWLSQVVFYALYRVGGMPLLTGFAAAVVTAAWFVVWQLTPGRPLVRIGLSVLAIGSTAGEWAIRPQIFTLLLLALTARFLVQRKYVLLPPLFLLWANLHGGVTLGVVVVSVAAALHVASTRRLTGWPVIYVSLAILMTLLTPLGWSLWTEMPAALARSRSYGIQEWRALDIRDPALLPLWLQLGLLGWLGVSSKLWRPLDDDDVLVWVSVILLPLAVNLSRNVPALETTLVPAIGMLIARRWPQRTNETARVQRPVFNAVAIAGALVVSMGVVAFAWKNQIPRLGWWPIPDAALAALAGCPGPVYNRYDDGGYLIWFEPTVKVFIDSRQDPYPPALMREHIAVETSGNYADLFQRYSIGCAFGPTDSVLTRRLEADGWRTLFTDHSWTLLAN